MSETVTMQRLIPLSLHRPSHPGPSITLTMRTRAVWIAARAFGRRYIRLINADRTRVLADCVDHTVCSAKPQQRP